MSTSRTGPPPVSPARYPRIWCMNGRYSRLRVQSLHSRAPAGVDEFRDGPRISAAQTADVGQDDDSLGDEVAEPITCRHRNRRRSERTVGKALARRGEPQRCFEKIGLREIRGIAFIA